MLKADFCLDKESCKAIAGLITHLITTYTEGYDIGISTDYCARLIYAIQKHCYEEPIFSPEQFQKIEQDKVPSPEFLASVFHAASDDYFFHWMAAFISDEPKTYSEFSKTSKDRFDREYTTAAYFALSQLKRSGADNAPDARLYYSIHHPYHSFRCNGKAPTQDSWLLSWTQSFLKVYSPRLLKAFNRKLLPIDQDRYPTKIQAKRKVKLSTKKSTTTNERKWKQQVTIVKKQKKMDKTSRKLQAKLQAKGVEKKNKKMI